MCVLDLHTVYAYTMNRRFVSFTIGAVRFGSSVTRALGSSFVSFRFVSFRFDSNDGGRGGGVDAMRCG